MNTLVIYESQFGNTRHVAELIGRRLEAHGTVRIAPIAEYEPGFQAGVDLVLVGAPTQAHGMTEAMRRFVESFEAGTNGTAAAAFDTRIKGPLFLWGSAGREISVRLERHGFRLLAEPESFLVTMSKEPVLHDGEEEHARAWADALAAKVPVAV